MGRELNIVSADRVDIRTYGFCTMFYKERFAIAVL